jgi:Fe2+ or Zn2+ uptake regulation protein
MSITRVTALPITMLDFPTMKAPRNTRDREDLACDLVDAHADRIVVCTPSKIVFEMKDVEHAKLAETSLKEHGYHTELHTVGSSVLLHAVF